jgi:hypothetical protein
MSARPSRSSLLAVPVALGFLLLGPPAARAYPLIAWTSDATPEGTLVLLPFFFASGDGKVLNPYLFASLGLSEHWDIYAGVSGVFGLGPPSAAFEALDVMPRYVISPHLALAPRVVYYPGNAIEFSPEVHTTSRWGNVSLWINLGVNSLLDLKGGGFTSTTPYARVSLEYAFSKQCWVVFEVDPSVTFTHGPEASVEPLVLLDPGFGFALDKEQVHTFTLGALIALPTASAPFDYASSVTYSAWYSTSFELWGGD